MRFVGITDGPDLECLQAALYRKRRLRQRRAVFRTEEGEIRLTLTRLAPVPQSPGEMLFEGVRRLRDRTRKERLVAGRYSPLARHGTLCLDP